MVQPRFVASLFAISTALISSVYGQNNYSGSGDVTQGRGSVQFNNLYDCEQANARPSPLGYIKGQVGITWTVPAETKFISAEKAVNLYDECTGTLTGSMAEFDQSRVPLQVIDEAGEEITAVIFADNYFELYINGQLIAVDAVPFTPFNSSIVKFKVSKPYQITVKLVDWEEHVGVGTEPGRAGPNSAGDGGFIARFSDGTVTNGDWRAQTFYTAPIYDLGCLQEVGQQRKSETCAAAAENGEVAQAIHWPMPSRWHTKDFDDSQWPLATTYSEETVGVDNKNAYMNFKEAFNGAEFIWSSNLVLDNHVIVRYTVE